MLKNIFGKAHNSRGEGVVAIDPGFLEEDQAPVAVAPPVPDEPAERWVGYIDHVERTLITGWCFDRENPDRAVAVEVIASNGKSKRVIAAEFRQDVKDAGYGEGNYGFEIDVASLSLKDESLVVRFAESKLAISKMPFSLDPQRALLEGKLPSSYTEAMRMLALDAQAKHAELEGSGFVL